MRTTLAIVSLLSSVYYASVATASASSAGIKDPSVVNTPSGPVQGLVFDTHRAFIGIPYGTPPINALRWRPSSVIAPWITTVIATSDPVGCPQICVTDEVRDLCVSLGYWDCQKGILGLAGRLRRLTRSTIISHHLNLNPYSLIPLFSSPFTPNFFS